MLDYETLDPGVRKLVRLLHAFHFETTDSGDGRTKLLSGASDDEVLDFPHVFMTVPFQGIEGRNSRGVIEANRLCGLMQRFLRPEGLALLGVEAIYSPIDGVHVLFLSGVCDDHLNEAGLKAVEEK